MKTISLLVFFLGTLLTSNAQQPAYKVYAVWFAQSGYPFTAADWSDGAPATDSVKIDFSVWVIKGNGKTILFDAGFENDIEDAAEFQLRTYTRPDSALQKMGIDPADVTDIILSHPHWDHIDGISLFPNAQLWMQQQDFDYFVGTAWQQHGDKGGFNKRDVRKLVEKNLAGRLTLVDGDAKEIIPGITVYTGSRHTYNSQYVLVKTGTNNIVLASDNIWIYYSLQHMVPASKGGTLDPAGYVKAMQRMKQLASSEKFIIPGHDARVFSIFPKVTEAVVEIK